MIRKCPQFLLVKISGVCYFHEGLLLKFLVELGESLVKIKLLLHPHPPAPSKFTDPLELWPTHTFQPIQETDFPRTLVEFLLSCWGDPVPLLCYLTTKIPPTENAYWWLLSVTLLLIHSFSKYLVSTV